MSETVNQEATANEPKTFTQEELDKILNDRLARERKKYEGINLDELKSKAARLDELEEASKTELEKERERTKKLQAELDGIRKAEEIRAIRDAVAKETGIPANLLTADDELGCREQAEAIRAFAIPAGYPSVKDGGDPQNLSGRSTRDEFALYAQQVL